MRQELEREVTGRRNSSALRTAIAQHARKLRGFFSADLTHLQRNPQDRLQPRPNRALRRPDLLPLPARDEWGEGRGEGLPFVVYPAVPSVTSIAPPGAPK